MSKISFDRIEFYITNVCNLDCQDCNRFNDYNFTGWQSWSDYAADYRTWSERIDIKHLVLLGGEPLLNPTILDWISGLSKLWSSPLQILSNGTRLNYVKNLYSTIRESRNFCFIGISLHNIDEQEFIFAEIEKFLQAPIKKIVGRNNNKFAADILFIDKNEVSIPVWIENNFTKSAVISLQNNKKTLHQSDPVDAHNACIFANNKNYHFIKGKFYKCGPVALFPEFDQQLKLELNPDDRSLINGYQPLTTENYEQYSQQFFLELDNPIPQCKFCPSSNQFKKIHPVLRKSNK